MSLIFSITFFVLAFAFLIYSKTGHFQQSYSPEVLTKKREEKIKANRTKNYNEIMEYLNTLALPSAHAKLAGLPANTPELSRIGGPVYLPEGVKYPLDIIGKPMIFVIQINFSDMPLLPGFPSTGVVQFFFRCNEEFGLSNDQEKKLRAIFLE